MFLLLGHYPIKYEKDMIYKNNEWKMLPSLPDHSLTTFWYADHDFLNVLIFPFQVNPKVKSIYYKMDIKEWEEWVSNPYEEKPIDFCAKFAIQIKYPAKIVHYPYYYFVDTTGQFVIKSEFFPQTGSFRTIENFRHLTEKERIKIQAKKDKKRSKRDRKNSWIIF